MIHSLRAFGYDLSMAVADLIDNSIYAGARTIRVSYDWNEGDPWVRIVDDGSGMTEARLYEAMRPGSTSPLEARDPRDLGRFGLGLKTASFAQCKLLVVKTKTSDGCQASRFWDLDYVQEAKDWKLGITPNDDASALLGPLDDLESGTVVLWKKLDRVVDLKGDNTHDPKESFLRRFLYVKEYLEMVFHRFLERKREGIQIFVGVAQCTPWDPYLRRNPFTQTLSDEKYEDNKVSVVPYVLPHVSNRTQTETEQGAGLGGWNSQQGFYVYRNKRMIVSGGYLDFDLKPEEHFKLARIQVDITNDMDLEWSIDVRKAVASPPDRLRADLLRIAKATRNRASEVYRARTGRARRRNINRETDDVWIRREAGEKILYRINLKNPVIARMLEEQSPPKAWVRKLFHVIEATVPHRLIIMDGLEHEDCHVGLPQDLTSPPEELLEMCREFYLEKIRQGRSHNESVDIVCSMEPFDTHPVYRAMLDGLTEDR